MQAKLAFQAYEKFATDRAIEHWQRLSDKAFHKNMPLLFKRDDSGRQVFYVGVGLITPRQEPEEREPEEKAKGSK